MNRIAGRSHGHAMLSEPMGMPLDDSATVEPEGMPQRQSITIEPTGMPRGYAATMEPAGMFSGQGTTSDGTESKRLHQLLKRMMFMPVAATMAVISIVFASFGYDPLGDRFVNQDENARVPEQSGKAYQGNLADASIHVTYVPSGEEYWSEATGKKGLAEAREWVRELKGDPDSLTFIWEETIDAGYDISDDAILVGDTDDMDSIYVAQGTVTKKKRTILHYEAYEMRESAIDSSEESTTDAKEESNADGNGANDTNDPGMMQGSGTQVVGIMREFPKLTNLEPDWAGNHSTSDQGPEYYIKCCITGLDEPQYLVAGSAVDEPVSNVTGLSYDAETNTLTLDHFTGDLIEAKLMGNGFKIKLVGENHVEKILLFGGNYGGSVTFTGTGSIVINEKMDISIWYATASYGGEMTTANGIKILGQASESCIMIEPTVTMELYGREVICVDDTLLDNAIYLAKGLKFTNNKFVEYGTSYWERYDAVVHTQTIDTKDAYYLRIEPK